MRGGGANGKRKPTGAFAGAPPPQPPPSVDYQRQLFNSRDSDASFASSRASDVHTTDRSHQSATIRSVNAFLSSHNSPISLRPHSVPPVKDISETLVLVLSTVDFHCDSRRWDEDVVSFLRSVKCPLKLTKSALRAPNSPHNWPNVLAVISWLVQCSRFHQQLASNPTWDPDVNSMCSFGIRSYCHFIRGEDDAVNDLDSEFMSKLESEKVVIAETIAGSEKIASELEAKLDALRKGPSKKEALEKAKSDLEKDVEKFRTMVSERKERNRGMEKVVEEKEKELVAKEEERGRISEENKELKRSVEVQCFNVRDVERMKRELKAVERDAEEAEGARDGWEQKAWEVNSRIGNQFHQIQRLAVDCNQALRRLKVVDVQFDVKESGESPEEVMGVEYKALGKPALCSLYDGIKEGLTKKAEEVVVLQQQVSEMASKIESRKSLLKSIQLQINEVEEKMRLVKKETQDLATKCDMEARTMAEGVRTEALNLDVVEKEAAEMLKASEVRLEEAVKQSEEEVQAVAAQLFALIDSISKHKEYMDSKILEVKTGVADTASAVSEIYKGSLKRHLGGKVA
ncbi:hypothetical protein Bca101_021270 [Brassica carinata]